MSVIAPATRPPVHDSAVASIQPRASRSARAELDRQRSVSDCRRRSLAFARPARDSDRCTRREAEPAVDGDRRRVVGARPAGTRRARRAATPRTAATRSERRDAAAARVRRGDHVEHAGELVLDRDLRRADDAAGRATRDSMRLSSGELREPLAMRVALLRRRAAAARRRRRRTPSASGASIVDVVRASGIAGGRVERQRPARASRRTPRSRARRARRRDRRDASNGVIRKSVGSPCCA